MTTPEEIEEQLQREDIQPYHNKVYDGELPYAFIEQFRTAMMFIPVTAHQYPMKDVESMAFKNSGEITNAEVGKMINIIYAVPFASMYSSLEEGIEKTKQYDKIRFEYNQQSAAFERKINAKRKRLLSLSGVGNSANMPPNGMRIQK